MSALRELKEKTELHCSQQADTHQCVYLKRFTSRCNAFESTQCGQPKLTASVQEQEEETDKMNTIEVLWKIERPTLITSRSLHILHEVLLVNTQKTAHIVAQERKRTTENKPFVFF